MAVGARLAAGLGWAGRAAVVMIVVQDDGGSAGVVSDGERAGESGAVGSWLGEGGARNRNGRAVPPLS